MWEQLIPIGASLLGSFFDSESKNESSSPGTAGYLQAIPDDPYASQLFSDTAQYLNQNIGAYSAGKTPAYIDTAINTMDAGAQQTLYQNTFGLPGRRTGTTQAATEAGAMTGVGPKATNSLVGKALDTWQEGSRLVKEKLAELKMGAIQNDLGMTLQGVSSLPRTRYQAFPGQPATEGTSPRYGTLAGKLASEVPWGSMFNTTTSANASPAYNSTYYPGYGGGTAAPADYYKTQGTPQYTNFDLSKVLSSGLSSSLSPYSSSISTLWNLTKPNISIDTERRG